MIELGRECTDQITGFRGVANGRCEYLSGCTQILLVPCVDKDGKLPESHWLDEQRLKYVGTRKLQFDNTVTPGFDKPAPRR
jgi:hypothetical protein